MERYKEVTFELVFKGTSQQMWRAFCSGKNYCKEHETISPVWESSEVRVKLSIRCKKRGKFCGRQIWRALSVRLSLDLILKWKGMGLGGRECVKFDKTNIKQDFFFLINNLLFDFIKQTQNERLAKSFLVGHGLEWTEQLHCRLGNCSNL